mgnify:CR=1 FL=1
MCSIMGLTTKALQQKDFQEFFDRTISRGPDMSRIIETKTGYLCFHRLAIMGLEESGMQPFTMGDDATVRFTVSVLLKRSFQRNILSKAVPTVK